MDIHVVQPGETISSIAQIYGVPEARLIQDNELINQNDLVPGQTIVIVYPKQTYTVQAGDTIESIANANRVSVMQLLRNNPFLSKRDYIYPGESLVISYDTIGQTSTLGYGIWSIMVYTPQLWLVINSQYTIVKLLPEST